MSAHGPVDHLFQVHEIAHAEILLAAQREYRYGHTRAAPWAQGVDQTLAGVYDCRAVGVRGDVEPTVVAALPGHYIAGGFLYYKKLIFA